MEKPKMNLAALILGDKKPKSEKSGAKEEKDSDSSSEKEAVAEDLISAIESGEAAAVVEALDAISKLWAGKKESDCGCD